MDLTKVKNREKFIHQCGEELIQEIKNLGLLFSPNVGAYIDRGRIEIGLKLKNGHIYDFVFASSITIHMRNYDEIDVTIPSSSSFNPFDNTASYWRTIHAGELIKNWLLVLPILKRYHTKVMVLDNIPVEKN